MCKINFLNRNGQAEKEVKQLSEKLSHCSSLARCAVEQAELRGVKKRLDDCRIMITNFTQTMNCDEDIFIGLNRTNEGKWNFVICSACSSVCQNVAVDIF